MAHPLKAAPGLTLEGRFLLLEVIGRGGMSTVFKASDLENPGQLVAVKVPLPQFSIGVGSWSMFQREAEIGAKLDHPSILRFVALEPRRDRSHVVTEFVAGRRSRPAWAGVAACPKRRRLRIMSRLCEAVEYLHGQQIVHYDLKPGNVFVCADGSIRLIDFGMAHQLVSGRFALGDRPRLSRPRTTSRPKHIRRRRGQRSVDIYALGAMLYEMLTGEAPFEGDDPFVIASARQIGDPRAPRALCPTISLETEEIVLRALRRDPTERYATVARLKADIDAPSMVRVSGLSTRLVEVTPWRRRLRWLRFVAMTGVAPVAVMVASFLLLWWHLARRH